MKQDRLSALIASLYDTALDPTEWSRVAQQFARAFAAESCAIWRVDPAQGAGILGITENFDAKSVSDYEAYYHQKDLVAIRMGEARLGQAMLSTEVVSEAEFRESEIFVDYARPQRLSFYWAVGTVGIRVDQNVAGAIGIHRPRDARAFEIRDKRRLELLLPHLSRAMLLQRRLQGLVRDRQIMLGVLEKLPVGVIAVDARATLLFANPTAERLLRAGLGLACRKGRLAIADQRKQEELLRLIQHAGMAARGMRCEPGGVLAVVRPQGRPLSLLVSPVPPQALSTGPDLAALVIFSDPDASPSTSVQALIAVYGLTPAEAKLVAALVAGERLEDYADRQRISGNTVRTLIKRVFTKTGHARQADLIRDILINPAIATTRRMPE